MRTVLGRFNTWRVTSLVLLLLCAALPRAGAVVAATIFPNLVTNDYLGKISITVTGLAVGKTLRIEKFADFNTNGVINPAESTYLWRSFLVTDGKLPLLGGATNLNVAGDMDGLSNGVIRADLIYPGSDAALDQFGAKYLYRITDTAGTFAFTNSFEVKQKILPQGVSGRVVAAGTGTPLTNAMVVVMPQSAPGAWGAAVTTGGYFTVYSPPGTYSLMCMSSGYVSGVSITVNSNVILSRNLTNTAATYSLSGKVSDNSSSAGLPGIMVFSQNASGLAALGTTDTNGNYSISLTSGQWKTKPTGSALAQLGYIGPNNAITSNVSGNVSGVNFPVPKATALIYGRLLDGSGNPLLRVTFSGNNSANQYQSEARSFPTNGDYALGTLAGDWCLGPNDDDPNIAGYPVPGWQCATLTNGGSARIDFITLPCEVVRITTTSPLPDGDTSSYYDSRFTALSGCYNNFNWYINDPQNAPPGLNLWSDGAFNGYPDTPGNYTFSVHADDFNGHSTNQPFSIHITGPATPLQVDTGSLPQGTNGIFYSQSLAASGGTPPYSWSLAPGSASLPPLITLGSNGVISGTPTNSGTFYFYARVTDSALNSTNSQLLYLYFITAPPVITNTSLPQATLGVAYHAQLGATGGQLPFNCWALALGSASLPPGLLLNCDGSITGTPNTPGAYTFIAQATDGSFTTATKLLAITVITRPSLSGPAWLTNRFQSRLSGATSQTYTIQFSTNLINWTDLFITNSGSATSLLVIDPAATNARRFYRAAAGTSGGLVTPYVNESDIASMNEAYSTSASSPWGFAHDGLDFMPNGDAKAFRAAGSGVVQTVDLWQNGSNWQVNVSIQHDSLTAYGYSFEPMSSLQTHGLIQKSNILVTAGQTVAAGDLLGFLHQTDSSSHVHFDIRTNSVAVCPEPYFTDEARASILRVLHLTYPGAILCY